MKKDGEAVARQNLDGSIYNFTYDAKVQREDLCPLIASNDLPLGFGESDDFIEYIQIAHTPNFKLVSRQATTRDMKRLCKTELTKIKEEFTTCTFWVSSRPYIRSGQAKQDYNSVVAHYVSDKQELQKRIIRFELIGEAHAGVNIAQALSRVVQILVRPTSFLQ